MKSNNVICRYIGVFLLVIAIAAAGPGFAPAFAVDENGSAEGIETEALSGQDGSQAAEPEAAPAAEPEASEADGSTKELATPAQVGVKSWQSKAEDDGDGPVGGWFIIELKGGQEYKITLYKGNKMLYPDDPDGMFGVHVYTAGEEEKEIKVRRIENNKSKYTDDELIFMPPANGQYYIHITPELRITNYDLLVTEVKLSVTGKIVCADAPFKGSYVNAYNVCVKNQTSAAINVYNDLYASDGTTLLSETGEPLASGHTFTYSLKSCKSAVIEGSLGALAEYKGYSIASDKKSITFKYQKLDGLAMKCEHLQKHEEEGSFCAGLSEDYYVNGTDSDITGRIVLYTDSEHSGIVCDQGGYTYQYNIPAFSSIPILDPAGEYENGTPEGAINKVIVFEKHEYDEASHTVTDYYHSLSGHLTPEQRQSLHEYSEQAQRDINAFREQLPSEIGFSYLDPQVSGIPYHSYDDVTSYLFTETPYVRSAGIKTSRYYNDGPLSVASQLRVKDLYLDEACTETAVQRDDVWVESGTIYARLGFETVATYDCGGSLGRYEIKLSETPDNEDIVVKVKLNRVLEPSSQALDQITDNKIKNRRLSFRMSDLKGLNADVLATSAIYTRLTNVKAFAGTSGAAAYNKLAGDSGLTIEGGYASEEYYGGYHDGVEILGNSDVLLGSTVVSSAYYLVGDVFYCRAENPYDEPVEIVRADNLFCISVDNTAADKAAAAEERIRNYFRNTADASVSVEKLSPADLAGILNARYLDDNDDYHPVKAAYMTKHGIALYSRAAGTTASDYVATINLPYTCRTMIEPALASADKGGQLSYIKYDTYSKSGEFLDTYTASSVDWYPLYRIGLTVNGEHFERIYLINGASAKEIAALDEEALAYYEDRDSGVILQAADGNIPVDTAADIDELNETAYTGANPDELGGKDVNVYDVAPYSSATGLLTDLHGSEMSVMLPVSDDAAAEVYCFDSDGKITETIPVDRYDEINGSDYAVFTASHFSVYGSAETACEHVIKHVDLKPATFEDPGVEAHYECEVCGRCFRDEQGSDRIRRKELVIPAATAKLSVTSYKYNGKQKTPSVICKGLTKGVDYKVTYQAGRKKVGSYTVTVKGIGRYSGEKKLKFRIIPATPVIRSLVPGSKRLTVNAASGPASKGAKSYQIAYKRKGTTKWKTVTVSAKSKTIKSLKKGKRYYVKMRAFKKVNGTTYYSAWTKAKLSKKIK